MDRGPWQAPVHGVTVSDMAERLNTHVYLYQGTKILSSTTSSYSGRLSSPKNALYKILSPEKISKYRATRTTDFATFILALNAHTSRHIRARTHTKLYQKSIGFHRKVTQSRRRQDRGSTMLRKESTHFQLLFYFLTSAGRGLVAAGLTGSCATARVPAEEVPFMVNLAASATSPLGKIPSANQTRLCSLG